MTGFGLERDGHRAGRVVALVQHAPQQHTLSRHISSATSTVTLVLGSMPTCSRGIAKSNPGLRVHCSEQDSKCNQSIKRYTASSRRELLNKVSQLLLVDVMSWHQQRVLISPTARMHPEGHRAGCIGLDCASSFDAMCECGLKMIEILQ